MLIFSKMANFRPRGQKYPKTRFFAPNLCQKPFLMVFVHFWDFSIFHFFWTHIPIPKGELGNPPFPIAYAAPLGRPSDSRQASPSTIGSPTSDGFVHDHLRFLNWISGARPPRSGPATVLTYPDAPLMTVDPTASTLLRFFPLVLARLPKFLPFALLNHFCRPFAPTLAPSIALPCDSHFALYWYVYLCSTLSPFGMLGSLMSTISPCCKTR